MKKNDNVLKVSWHHITSHDVTLSKQFPPLKVNLKWFDQIMENVFCRSAICSYLGLLQTEELLSATGNLNQ